MKTSHFQKINSPLAIHQYASDQGGNLGVVVLLRKSKADSEVFKDTGFGVVRNSFGKLSFVVQKGIGYKVGKFEGSINAGFMSGYDNLFVGRVDYVDPITGENMWWELGDMPLPKIMKDLGVLPTFLVSISYKINDTFRPTVNVSPEFINVGMTIKFK